jgi:hypothetical protein
MATLRPLTAIALVLSLLGCSGYHRQSAGYPVQTSLLQIGLSSGGPAPTLSSATIFDHGTVMLDDGNRAFLAVLPDSDLTEIRAIAASAEFTRLLKWAAAQDFRARYSDYQEIMLYVPGEDGHVGAEIPSVEITAELRAFLVRIDRVLTSAFGSRYRMALSKRGSGG